MRVATKLQSAARASSALLVGRDADLHVLRSAVSAPPSLVLIEGEAGVGKSRLVAELLDKPDLPPVRHLVGMCHTGTAPFPLGPFVEALSAVDPALLAGVNPVAGTLRPLLPEFAAVLPSAPDPVADPHTERHRLFRAVGAVLEQLAPVILVVEDVHWADDLTMELVAYLAARPPSSTTLVVTYRREDVRAGSPLLALLGTRPSAARVERVVLGLLTVDQVGTLAGAILGSEQVSREFAHFLHERTSGLPFAVEEVVRLLAERHDLTREDGHWVRKAIDELVVPPAVADSVVARVDRLPPAARAVLAAAAVLEGDADEASLQSVTGLPGDAVDQGLEATFAAGLLQHSPDRYGFRHALVRDAVYESLAPPARRLLHGRAADHLSERAEPPLAALARHCRMAGRTEDWTRYAAAAAELARNLRNDRAAVELLAEVLDAPGVPPGVVTDVALPAGYAALEASAPERVLPALHRVLEHTKLDRELRGELRFVVGRLLLRARRLDEGRAVFLAALDDLDDRPAMAANTMASIAFTDMMAGKPDSGLRWLDSAQDLAATVDDALLHMLIDVDRATVLMMSGDVRGCAAVAAVPRTSDDPEARWQVVRLCSNAAMAAVRLGHHDLARQLHDEAITASGGEGWAVYAVRSTALLLDWAGGRWEELDERCVSFVDDPLRAFPPEEALVVHAVLGLARGDSDAEQLLRSFLAESETVFPHVGGVALGALIRVVLSRGEVAEATDLAVRALDVIAGEEPWLSFSESGVAAIQALVAAGRSDDAAYMVAEAARVLAGRDAPAAHAALAHAQGVLAERRQEHDAAGSYRRAVEAWRDVPRPYDAAHATADLGRCLLRRGEVTDGAQALVDALEAYERLGAGSDAARIRRTLRQAGVRIPARGGRRSYGDELSPREREVVALAATGLTNREIGTELFLSPRTVGDHVARALRKLGLSSRRQLIKEAAGSAGNR